MFKKRKLRAQVERRNALIVEYENKLADILAAYFMVSEENEELVRELERLKNV